MSKARVKSAVIEALTAEGVRDAMISVAFVGRAAIARLNQKYLGHRGATDVISFGFSSGGKRGGVIGDIYICPDVARVNARGQGVRAGEELLRLVVHGTLHVLGYDHPEDGRARVKSKMWQKQEKILARLV
ncbi:MAG TPA: rRNA maturation RNase YbeY [Gemmatimonadaceae bacterium]|nr:rRNA maturation RNase YbeY [Gemmatimonadaceae bacterium]